MRHKYNSGYLRLGGKVSAASLHRKLTRPHLDQVGLFLGCVSCHSSAEVFFLLNFLVVEGSCEVFGLEDLADLYVAFAIVAVGASLDPLDRLFERLNLPEPEAGDEFLAFGEGAVNDGAVLAGEVEAGAPACCVSVMTRAVASSTPRGNMALSPEFPSPTKQLTTSSGHSGDSFRTVPLAALNLRAGNLRLSS